MGEVCHKCQKYNNLHAKACENAVQMHNKSVMLAFKS